MVYLNQIFLHSKLRNVVLWIILIGSALFLSSLSHQRGGISIEETDEGQAEYPNKYRECKSQNLGSDEAEREEAGDVLYQAFTEL